MAESVFEIIFHEDEEEFDEMYNGLYMDCFKIYVDMIAKLDDMAEKSHLDDKIMGADEYQAIRDEIVNTWDEDEGQYAWGTEEIMTCYDTMKEYYENTFIPMLNVHLILWVVEMGKATGMTEDECCNGVEFYKPDCSTPLPRATL